METFMYLCLYGFVLLLVMDHFLKGRVALVNERVDRLNRRLDTFEHRQTQTAPLKKAEPHPDRPNAPLPIQRPPLKPKFFQAPPKPHRADTVPASPPPNPSATPQEDRATGVHHSTPTAKATTPVSEKATLKEQPNQASAAYDSPAHFNWEQFMGARLFAWLGGFALFLAAGFFIKYSFDNNLISPELRVSIGYLVGLSLLGAGTWMPRQTYRVTADTFCAVGVVILYAVTFTCHAVYQFPLFGTTTTFLLMSLNTIVAFTLSVRLKAQVIAVLGMLGGFLTPVLVSSGPPNASALFAYIAFLDIGLAAVAAKRRWDWLNFGAIIGTTLFQVLWISAEFDSNRVADTMTILHGFSILYLAISGFAWRQGTMNPWLAKAATLPPLVTLLFSLRFQGLAAIGGAPTTLFAFLGGAGLCLQLLSIFQARVRSFPAAGGGLTFLILSLWTTRTVTEDMLFWALGGYVGFAILYTACPIIIRHRWPNTPISPFSQLFPAISLLTMLIPMFQFKAISFIIWPAISLLVLLAFASAIALVSTAGIVFAFLSTVVLGIVWLVSIPVTAFQLTEGLVVIVGMVIIFQFGSVYLFRVIDSRKKSFVPGAGLPAWLTPSASVEAQLPAMSAIFPFLLLVMMTLRLPLEHPTPIFATALFIGALILGLARFARMEWLPMVGLGCSFLLQLVWSTKNGTSASPVNELSWALGFYSLYFLFPFALLKFDASRTLTWVAAALSGPVHFCLVYPLIENHWPNPWMGLVPAAFATPTLLALVQLSRQLPKDHRNRNTLLAWFGGVALLFITLIFPIQFERQWLTIGWALEGMALIGLFHRVPHHGLRYTGFVLLTLAFVRLALNPETATYFPRGSMPLLNGYLYTYCLVAGALFSAAKLTRPPNHRIRDLDTRGALMAMGTLLIFILVNIEIADFFREPGQSTLRFDSRGNLAQNLAYTIAWAGFALMMLIIGIIKQLKLARYAGIALMALTLLKLFLHDLASLSQLYRVGALVGVAAMAIIASVLYQRFLGSEQQENSQDERSN